MISARPCRRLDFRVCNQEIAGARCVERWKEALEADMAPMVVLAATHISALEFVTMDELQAHAVDE